MRPPITITITSSIWPDYYYYYYYYSGIFERSITITITFHATNDSLLLLLLLAIV